jgi:hypothetical protein
MELEQIVFEVRYHYGTLYLDRCGRIVRELTLAAPEWIFKDATPQSGSLFSSSNGTILNFNISKIDLSLQRSKENPGLKEKHTSAFIEQVGATVPMILDRLDIEEKMISRIGCRVILSFPMESECKSQEWISSRDLFAVSGFSRFADGKIISSSCAVVIDDEDVSYRVSMNTAEHPTDFDAGHRRIPNISPRKLPHGQREALLKQMRESKKASNVSQWAVILDVDSFCDEPTKIEAAAFVEKSHRKVVDFANTLEARRGRR